MASAEFHVGGHVPLDSPAYADREFVQRCFDELAGGRWVVLLGPRQHGKTSGLVRLAALLQAAGVRVAQLSLQGIPDASTAPELFEWIARRIATQFGIDLVQPEEADQGDLDAWLARALPPEAAQTVLVFDEAAAIRDDELRSNFYHQLRRLHDERNSPRSSNLGSGLALLFSGTFEPKRLVADDLASPFNVCRTVDTEDLTAEAARDLVDRLDASLAAPLVDRAVDLVGGQPFLLQYLFSEAERGDGASPAEERFQKAEERLLAGDSEHLASLLSSVVNDQPVREIVRQIVRDGSVPFEATPEHRMVVVLGFGRREGGMLVPRNRLYREVASGHFLLSAADAPATGAKVAPPGAGSLNFVVDADLRKVAEEMLEAGFDAFNGGHIRLGLIGLGSALEAILIDLLEQASQSDLNVAKGRAHPHFQTQEKKITPGTWRLVNLIKVADELPAMAQTSVAGAHMVRELRNYVHPALVRESGLAQADLGSEFTAAQGVLGVVIREAS
jgi:AAA-like domain